METETKDSHFEKSDISKRDNIDKFFGRKTQTEIIEEKAEKEF